MLSGWEHCAFRMGRVLGWPGLISCLKRPRKTAGALKDTSKKLERFRNCRAWQFGSQICGSEAERNAEQVMPRPKELRCARNSRGIAYSTRDAVSAASEL